MTFWVDSTDKPVFKNKLNFIKIKIQSFAKKGLLHCCCRINSDIDY